jgi:DNA-binding MarR family transcriptional regulator
MRLTTFMDQLRVAEERGHARRMPNPSDGRSLLVTLTAAGLAAHREANRLFEAAYESFAAELGGSAEPAKQALASIRGAAERAMLEPVARVSPRPSRGRAG